MNWKAARLWEDDVAVMIMMGVSAVWRRQEKFIRNKIKIVYLGSL